VAVVVIDTGIDFNHPDLAGNMAQLEANCANGVDDDGNGFIDDCRGINAIGVAPPTSNPMDDVNHGTHVSGTIGAVGNNSTGVVGVNHTVKLIACKFLGVGGGFTDDAIQCLNYIIATKNVHPELQFVGSNNSWGGRGFDQALADAIEVQRQNGLLFIAAAGNENADNDWILNSPANIFQPNVIAVAATTRNDGLAGFSTTASRPHMAPRANGSEHHPGNTQLSAALHGHAAYHRCGGLLKAQDGTRDWKKIKNLIPSSGDPISALTNTTVPAGASTPATP
jgi:subtilisin family serine protease